MRVSWGPAAVAMAAMAALAGSAAGQGRGPFLEEDRTQAVGLRVTVHAGGSVREVDGLRLADDVRTLSGRLTLRRRYGAEPWVQVETFTRPGLEECPGGLVCNTDGWTALAGFTVPSAGDDRQPGLHLHLVGGIGWAFSTENRFAYLLGVGGTVPITRFLAPAIEVRYEDLPGIRNVMMINLGLRVDLF